MRSEQYKSTHCNQDDNSNEKENKHVTHDKKEKAKNEGNRLAMTDETSSDYGIGSK